MNSFTTTASRTPRCRGSVSMVPACRPDQRRVLIASSLPGTWKGVGHAGRRDRRRDDPAPPRRRAPGAACSRTSGGRGTSTSARRRRAPRSRSTRRRPGPFHIGYLLENVPELSFWLGAGAVCGRDDGRHQPDPARRRARGRHPPHRLPARRDRAQVPAVARRARPRHRAATACSSSTPTSTATLATSTAPRRFPTTAFRPTRPRCWSSRREHRARRRPRSCRSAGSRGTGAP